MRRRQAAATAAAPGSTTCGIASPSALSSVVSSGHRCRTGDPQAGHLPRARACERDVLVPRGRPGVAGTGGTPAGKPEGGRAMSPDTDFSGLVQAFFTDRLLRQRRASPHTVAGYRDTFRLLLRFAKRATGEGPVEVVPQGSGRALRRRLPRSPREGPRQRRPEPEHTPGGHPFLLPLPLVPGAGLRRPVPPHPGHPQQALRAEADRIPHGGGDRRAAGRAGPDDLDRPPGPGPAAGGDPDGAEGVRTHRPATLRHHPGHRGPRPLRGEGPESSDAPHSARKRSRS